MKRSLRNDFNIVDYETQSPTTNKILRGSFDLSPLSNKAKSQLDTIKGHESPHIKN